MNVMRETKNFPFCSDLQSIVFFALFFGNNNNNDINNNNNNKREMVRLL